jgi:23S rRNA pseudouridine1911/1915/1917 synthase
MQSIIDAQHDGVLLRSYLLDTLGVSHRLLTRLKQLPDGILLDGQHVTVRAMLHEGQMLTLALEDTPDTPHGTIVPSSTLPDILYEDEDVLVCNKPYGMPTHPSHGHFDDTLANAVAHYERLTRGQAGIFRPINRLDRDTSGVVLIARHQLAASRLSEAMCKGNIRKRYLAILEGIPHGHCGVIDAPICRERESIITRCVCTPDTPGAHEALTLYRVVARWSLGFHERSLVCAEPKTGRTHQLRVHFAHVGAPIAGDDMYGQPYEDIPTPTRQALHAYSLTFPHPMMGRTMTVLSPLGEDLRTYLPPFPTTQENV